MHSRLLLFFRNLDKPGNNEYNIQKEITQIKMNIHRIKTGLKPCNVGVYGWYVEKEYDYQAASGKPISSRDLKSTDLIFDNETITTLHTFQVHAETRNLR